MRKFTRRHYNKKLIALGLSAFMGVGLTSTGFAAWVMSKDTEQPATGGVSVSTMTDVSASFTLFDSDNNGLICNCENCQNERSNLTFSDVIQNKNGHAFSNLTPETDNSYTLKDSFSFDALTTDVTGRLRWSGSEGEGEDLSVSVYGRIDGATEVEYVVGADIDLPASIQAAIDARYLTGPVVNVTPLDIEGYENYFTVSISLGWGDKFKGINPCEYYDAHYDDSTEDAPLGEDVSNEKMEEEMEAFLAILHDGLTASDEVDSEGKPVSFAGTFNIILSATAQDGTVSQ